MWSVPRRRRGEGGVDVVGAGAAERVGERGLHRRRARVVAEPGGARIALSAELHADDDAVAVTALERLADEQLVVAHAVEVAGVDQGDAGIEGRVDGRDALGPVGRAVHAGHAHRAEADLGDLRAGGAERTGFDHALHDGGAMDDPLRMFIVVRRGAVQTIARGGELAREAAVRCLRAFADDERFAGDIAAWRPRPGKVTLRARGGQWDQLLESEAHVAGGDGVVALPPRLRSARVPLLERLQAMTSALQPPPEGGDPRPEAAAPPPPPLPLLFHPRLKMGRGKPPAQPPPAAVMAADGGAVEAW